jgi:nitrate reductase (NAD(P)H)
MSVATQHPAGVPIPPSSEHQPQPHAASKDIQLPPTPPETVIGDAHVHRDSRLIRLTGVHPFNVEAPLTDLYNEGFLTSPELFYVRNHGAVPEVHDSECLDWEFSVEGYDQSASVQRFGADTT